MHYKKIFSVFLSLPFILSCSKQPAQMDGQKFYALLQEKHIPIRVIDNKSGLICMRTDTLVYNNSIKPLIDKYKTEFCYTATKSNNSDNSYILCLFKKGIQH